MKMQRVVCLFCLLLVSVMAIGLPGMVLAQDAEAPASKITLDPAFPTVESIAGSEFAFETELVLNSAEASVFDLRTTGPEGWEVYMTPQYEKDKKISSISLKPSFTSGTKIRVVAQAPFWPLPDPGDYKIKVEAISDNLEGSVELTARVTAKYILAMVPTNELYNTEAQAGKENYFSVDIGNLGTAPIENIKFSSTKPEGWNIDFEPEKVDSIESFDTQAIDINIQPPADAISGDYNVTIRASGQQTTTDEVKLRVTVKTSPTWQWVGVGVIVLVVAAVVVIFMRFSRR
ncbi:NEW3 domain-containing protein [Chloroflexota bacterium]